MPVARKKHADAMDAEMTAAEVRVASSSARRMRATRSLMRRSIGLRAVIDSISLRVDVDADAWTRGSMV
jgi:hypothetical protein